MKIFVTDGAEPAGSATVQELKRQNFSVVAGVRKDSDAHGLDADEVRVVDFADPESFFHAMTGCEGMFLALPLTEQMKKQGNNAVLAAKEAGVQHIVRSSGLGASHDAHWRLGRELGFVDLVVEESGIPFTILRANMYMQHFSSTMADPIRTGCLPLPFGDAKVSFIDARDIASCAAAAFAAPDEHGGKTYALTGPQALTGADVARTLSSPPSRMEHSVTYTPLEEADYMKSLAATGMPQWNIDMLVSLSRIIRRDMAWNVTGAVQHLTGSQPRPLDAFVREYADCWQ